MKSILRSSIVLCGVAFAVLFFGCAHKETNAQSTAANCSAVIYHSPTEIDFCTGQKDFKVGDKIVFLRDFCSAPNSYNRNRNCSKVTVGEGSIIKVLDEHISTIKLDSQFEVSSTMTIEMKK